MSDKKKTSADVVRAMIAAAQDQAREAGADRLDPETPFGSDRTFSTFDGEGDPGTQPKQGDRVDPDAVQRCAGLDHSDTDNGERLLTHFGSDLLVLSQAKARAPLYLAWTGTHWDMETGGPRAFAIAQNVGGRIALEAQYLNATPDEAKAINAAAEVRKKADGERTKAEDAVVKAAEKAEEALGKRKSRRMNHAVTSKNKAKLDAMLACAAVHIMREPNTFNADHLRVACRTHTLVFRRTLKRRRNPAFDDPDDSRQDIPEFVEAVDGATVDPIDGHRRGDLITTVIPVDYDPQATCPRWDDFMGEFLPNAEVRRMVQVATGIGLLGVTVQKLFFHYGSGANGKSVYMETICRLLGGTATTLPADSFIGEAKGGGSANPDLARLYGKRHLRVQELPEGEDLREDLVKKLTGGEDISVRDLFQGYFDFRPIFTGHMSGNGFPRISGTDNGIWRRMAVVHWPVTIPPERQKDFEDVVSSFEPERAGILNWMIEGALIFLREGLVIPDAVKVATQDYRDTMDPTSAFCAACVREDADGSVQAKTFFEAYVNWCIDAGKQPVTMTKFGRIMKSKFTKEEGRINRYLGIRLVDVPVTTGGHDDYEAHLR